MTMLKGVKELMNLFSSSEAPIDKDTYEMLVVRDRFNDNCIILLLCCNNAFE